MLKSSEVLGLEKKIKFLEKELSKYNCHFKTEKDHLECESKRIADKHFTPIIFNDDDKLEITKKVLKQIIVESIKDGLVLKTYRGNDELRNVKKIKIIIPKSKDQNDINQGIF